MKASLSRCLVAEFGGTAFLVAAVVGSGIMAERLSGGNVGLALLANTLATGAALVALILALGPVSGAQLNPVVTLAFAIKGELRPREAVAYALVQIAGGVSGTIAAHLMFSLPVISLSHHARSGPAQVFSEFVATFGLLAVILACVRFRADRVAYAVGAYITAAYWFTSSTSFANPAVTAARALTDTFAGIRPVDMLPFICAQIGGAVAATYIFRWLLAEQPGEAPRLVSEASHSDRGTINPRAF